MMLKNRKFIKGTALCLIVALMTGSFVLSKKNSKADSAESDAKYDLSNLTESNKAIIKENIKKFTDCFRTNNVEITIDNIDKLYSEFDKRNKITDEVVDELLSCSTDKFILQYLKNESSQISSVIENISEDNENHSMTNILRSQNDCF